MQLFSVFDCSFLYRVDQKFVSLAVCISETIQQIIETCPNSTVKKTKKMTA